MGYPTWVIAARSSPLYPEVSSTSPAEIVSSNPKPIRRNRYTLPTTPFLMLKIFRTTGAKEVKVNYKVYLACCFGCFSKWRLLSFSYSAAAVRASGRQSEQQQIKSKESKPQSAETPKRRSAKRHVQERRDVPPYLSSTGIWSPIPTQK